MFSLGIIEAFYGKCIQDLAVTGKSAREGRNAKPRAILTVLLLEMSILCVKECEVLLRMKKRISHCRQLAISPDLNQPLLTNWSINHFSIQMSQLAT